MRDLTKAENTLQTWVENIPQGEILNECTNVLERSISNSESL